MTARIRQSEPDELVWVCRVQRPLRWRLGLTALVVGVPLGLCATQSMLAVAGLVPALAPLVLLVWLAPSERWLELRIRADRALLDGRPVGSIDVTDRAVTIDAERFDLIDPLTDPELAQLGAAANQATAMTRLRGDSRVPEGLDRLRLR